MRPIGYYVGPSIDTELGSGTVLCAWCYRDWEEEPYADFLGEHGQRLVEFGYRPSVTLDVDWVEAEVARQSHPIFSIDESDRYECCEACGDLIEVSLTSDGVLNEGRARIDELSVRNLWDRKPGTLPGWTDLGGYTLVYYVVQSAGCQDDLEMCGDCAARAVTEHLPDYRIVGVDTYDEGPPILCDGWCGEEIVASYGDPDEEEENDAQASDLSRVRG